MMPRGLRAQHNVRRRRAWGPRGEDNDISKLFNPDAEIRYTLLAATDMDGFVLGACEVVERERGHADEDRTRGAEIRRAMQRGGKALSSP